jgi:CBS domain-containing protein
MKRLPTIRDHMDTYVHTLREDVDIYEAIAFLLDNKVTGAPVVRAENELVGILTEKDCLNVMTKGRDADVATGTVGDYMTANPVTLSPKMDIYYAAGLFLNHEFRRLPVVEDGLLLVGAITRFDLLRAVRNNWQ